MSTPNYVHVRFQLTDDEWIEGWIKAGDPLEEKGISLYRSPEEGEQDILSNVVNWRYVMFVTFLGLPLRSRDTEDEEEEEEDED